MNQLIIFFGAPFFIIVGGIATLIMIGGFAYTAFLIIKGVLPVWYRLGLGLSKGKIAVFSSSEFSSLRDMITSSKIFKENNIIEIHKNDMKKSKDYPILLVHWKDFKNDINEIINLKENQQALIVYAPQEEGLIEDNDVLKAINMNINSVVVNFRGRLMNDLITSLITVSYDK